MQKYHKNPRKISDHQREMLEENLRELGDLSGIVHDLNSNEIVGGNQRGDVFDINRCEIEITEQYDEPDEQGTVAHGFVVWQGKRYAYRQVRWTPRQAERANITANRLGGEWDFEALEANFDYGDLIDWGFEPGDLDFAPTVDPTGDTEPQIDRAEELREQWGVETGQLWQLGSHRLICGDCTDADVVARVLQGDVPLLMVTDPPYGVNYDPAWRNEAAEAGLLAYAASRVGEVQNDDRVDWSDAYNLFPGDVIYTWSPPGDPVILTGLVLQGCGYQIRNQIMWRKPHFPISRGHYTYQHEPCWYAVRKGKQSHWIGDANASTVWDISLDKNVEGGHSTQKPLECMARPIRNHDSEFVYEPFCGSGTTIIACENLGRRCRAIEISPAFVAVCLQRYLDHTNQAPVLLE